MTTASNDDYDDDSSEWDWEYYSQTEEEEEEVGLMPLEEWIDTLENTNDSSNGQQSPLGGSTGLGWRARLFNFLARAFWTLK